MRATSGEEYFDALGTEMSSRDKPSDTVGLPTGLRVVDTTSSYVGSTAAMYLADAHAGVDHRP